MKGQTYVIEETDPWMRIIDLETQPENEKARFEQAKKIIRLIASNDNEPNIFVSAERGILVRKASAATGMDKSTISRYLKRYWKRGKTLYSLISDYDKCGAAGKDRKIQKKLGRKRIYTSQYEELVITDDIKRLFRISLEKFYYSAKRPTLRRAYEQMIAEYFASERKVEGGSVPIVEIGKAIPTLGQFRYWFNKWRMKDIKKEVSTREGPRKYHQQYKPVLGTTQQDVDAPALVYQIDATILDITIVSTFQRSKILGRPTFYLTICGYSHMITGYHLTLDPPSWEGAMMSLICACESKVDLCKRFGIEIREEEWPSVGLPQYLLADRGELISGKALSMIEHLNIGVMNTPPFFPMWKPLVERYFGIIQHHATPSLPGAVYKDAKDRGVRDNRITASLTLDEINKIILKFILHYNNQHYLSDYIRTTHQIEENVSPIPIKLWNYGIKHKSGKLRQVSPDILRFNMLPSEKATVYANGIKWRGMLYSCETALKEKYFIRARMNGSFKCDVSFDPRNVSQIYLRLGRNEYDVCYLLESQARYKDQTLDDIIYLLEAEQQDQVTAADKELGSRISLAAEIDAIVKEAVAKTKAESKPESKAKKLRDIRENRRQEKDRNREQESIVLEGVRRANPPSTSEEENEGESSSTINHLTLLKKIQQEGFNGNR
ncbi:Mu transposase C-terminal domain-containing protein [Paenibacillus sp. FSL L8-0709]|uniref:Mu transposase C-terminal domain-containing protein n=1 Tax=Paenibacillus sp. FSL L8-0709 TaxID=2975312 RepID=UPI0030F81DEE